MEKILVWIDDPVSFGIAKAVNDHYEYELFAIFDVANIRKKFFSQQKFVSFKKIWFYRDHVCPISKKPNLEYLKNFERQYGINLWQLVYSERVFYKYNVYYKFAHDEILAILESECRFLEKLLDEIKPDYLFMRTTDIHRTQLLSDLCKSKGIRVLMLSPTRFGYRFSISSELDKFDNNDAKNIPYVKRNLKELQKFVEKFNSSEQGKLFYQSKKRMSLSQRIVRYIKLLSIMSDNDYKKFYDNFGRTRFKFMIKRFPGKNWIVIKRRESFLNNNSIISLNNNDHFVYFPLHIEPERTLSVAAPFYTNQLEIITHISKSLPVGYKLYVKEHPVQKVRGWRTIDFYKKILELPNVNLVHPSIKSEEMLKNCSLVITITGTTGIEAAFYEKPSIVFTDVSYSSLPFVHRLKNIEELPTIIGKFLEEKFDYSSLNDYVNFIENKSFEVNLTKIYTDLKNYFDFATIYGNAEDISSENMKSFLINHESEFKKIAEEHIKKINEYKNFSEN